MTSSSPPASADAEAFVRKILESPVPFSVEPGEILVFNVLGTLETASQVELFAVDFETLRRDFLDDPDLTALLDEVAAGIRAKSTLMYVRWEGGVELLWMKTACYPVMERAIGDA